MTGRIIYERDDEMGISGVISAILIGLIIGALGRLVLPGRQRIGKLLAMYVSRGGVVVGFGRRLRTVKGDVTQF
ncbi:hypothetical protein GCM10012286_80700 [Streptomyces lasiicapitis]|uniref:Uncharacterized protein n=1 Tax=Streptomyces lasiicapitis TaxID=1923961 RepID=A0ABQ2MWM0_9ACTN|nr:hypothetical protein GCM10012286_80700 [Streptomyces lasiicapitis]